jgi:hypothetical protein
MQRISARPSVGVDPGGWDDLGVAVFGHPDLPVALVDQGVMETAETATILHAGGSTVHPAARLTKTARETLSVPHVGMPA